MNGGGTLYGIQIQWDRFLECTSVMNAVHWDECPSLKGLEHTSLMGELVWNVPSFHCLGNASLVPLLIGFFILREFSPGACML